MTADYLDITGNQAQQNFILYVTITDGINVDTGPTKFAGLCIDISNRLVLRDNKETSLTFTEFEILLLLARNAGRVFSKEQIYDIVWKEPYSGDYNIVMSHIRNIREKIEDNPSKPVYIQTVWGVGYRFNQKMNI